jgi:hypothetical protein
MEWKKSGQSFDGIGWPQVQSVRLLVPRLLDGSRLVEFCGQPLRRPGTYGSFDKSTGLLAGTASKAFGDDRSVALEVDGNLDGLAHATPPATLIVSLMDPFGRACSAVE